MGFLKISSKSSPASVAGAIAALIKDNEPVTLQCIGAASVNQAVKAVCIVRSFVMPLGLDVSLAPTFSQVEIHGDSRTAIRLVLYVHKIQPIVASVPSELEE